MAGGTHHLRMTGFANPTRHWQEKGVSANPVARVKKGTLANCDPPKRPYYDPFLIIRVQQPDDC